MSADSQRPAISFLLYPDDGTPRFFSLAMIEGLWTNGGSGNGLDEFISDLPKVLCKTPFPWEKLPLEVKTQVMEYSLHDCSEMRLAMASTSTNELSIYRLTTFAMCDTHVVELHVGIIQLGVSQEFDTIGLSVLSRTLRLDSMLWPHDFNLDMFADTPMFCRFLMKCLPDIRSAQGLVYDHKRESHLVEQLSYFQALKELILVNNKKYVWVNRDEGHFEPHAGHSLPLTGLYSDRSPKDSDAETLVRKCLDKRPEITRLRLLLQRHIPSCKACVMVYVDNLRNTPSFWNGSLITKSRWCRIWI